LNIITYRNGFKINDGPFRSLEDPANQKFMADVKKGYIPQELVDQGLTDLGITLQERYKNHIINILIIYMNLFFYKWYIVFN